MFPNTKKALEVFWNAIECVQCKKPSKDLQYLGDSCKHAFCWDCISVLNQKVPGKRNSTRKQCPSCAFPLDTTKIIGAQVLNTCFDTLSELKELLEKVEVMPLTEADLACTQRLFHREPTPLEGNREAVERFLETQAHMPDELGQGDDDEDVKKVDNRENSCSPELDVFHDYTSPSRSSVKRPAPPDDVERRPKRTSILRDSAVKNEQAFDLFSSQIPTRTIPNDTLTPFVQRRSTAPARSGIGKFAQPFGSAATTIKEETEEDPFMQKVVLKKRETSLRQSVAKEPKLEPIESLEPDEMPSTSKSRRSSVKFERIERRSQSPMSFGEKSMSLKPEQRRSSYGTRRGEVVIINSILNNRIPQLKSAIEAGTCVNEKDNIGKTPLFVAVEQNSLEAVKILVEAGAIINATCGPTFETTLHEAIRRKNCEIVEYLLSKGASLKIRNINGKTGEELAKNDGQMRKIVEKYKNEQRVLQPVIPPPQSKIHFVQLIDEKMISESDKRKLPGKINLVPSDMDTPTHVVVAVDLKTKVLNISKEHIGGVLKAIIKSGMIVSKEWLKVCIIDPSKVDNDRNYMVKKVRWMESQVFENTIEMWKKTITRMQPKLFAGCKFYIPKHKYNFLDRPTLIEIIRSAGGQAAARETIINEKDPAPYHNPNLKPNFVVYSLTHDIGDKYRDCSKYNLVSEQWLIESILACSISTPPH